MSAGKYPDIET